MDSNQQIKDAFNNLILVIINNLSMKSTWMGIGHGIIAIWGFIKNDAQLIALGCTGFGAGVAYGYGPTKKDDKNV